MSEIRPLERAGGLAKLVPGGEHAAHDRLGDGIGVDLVVGVADTSLEGVELHLFHGLHAGSSP